MTHDDRSPSAGPEASFGWRPGSGPGERPPADPAPLRAPAETGALPGRSRSFAAPPPDPAEALYYEGMAAYQHRNWEQALDRFSRLKELQPTRPGLDALLDEVRWFLQLQATAPGALAAVETPPHGRTPLVAHPAPRLHRGSTLVIVLLAVIGIVALMLIAFQGRLPWTTATAREAQELYNRGQARLAVGDYEGAQAAFKKVLEISADDPEAQLGLARAERQQALAQEYAAAEAAMAEENWDKAAAQLAKILTADPSYTDAQAKADFVAQRQRLAALYADGSRLYDLGQWEDAIAQFEKIRELDGGYRAEAVAEFLFVSYLNAGQALIEGGDGSLPTVERAVELFSRAVTIHPRNRLASDARRLGGLYLNATRAMANGDEGDAQAQLAVLLDEAPAYAQGKAADLLYALLLRSGDDAVQAGNAPSAINYYRQAQAVPVADQSAAVKGEARARALTPTPVPQPTAPPSPTPTAPPLVAVRSGTLSLRAGPGFAYREVGRVAAGTILTVTGRTADDAWLRVCCTTPAGSAATGQQGWLARTGLDVQGPLAAVAVVTPTPPAPRATPRPTDTAPPTAACLEVGVYDTAGGGWLPGWTITLQGQDGKTRTAQSRPEAAYRFTDLPAGIYTVSLRLEAGWRAVSPQTSSVTLTPAATCIKVDFWNERAGGEGAAPPGPKPTTPPSPPPPTPER